MSASLLYSPLAGCRAGKWPAEGRWRWLSVVGPVHASRRGSAGASSSLCSAPHTTGCRRTRWAWRRARRQAWATSCGLSVRPWLPPRRTGHIGSQTFPRLSGSGCPIRQLAASVL